jgi:hypothetical protein
MRKLLSLATISAAALVTQSLFAQVVDPHVVGPTRRATAAAGNAAGAPGVEPRIENREQRRDVIRADVNANAAGRASARANDADRWRFKYHNNQWWYYTPQNQWMYHANNNWQTYDRDTYAAPAPRYTTGYRGYNNGYYNNGRAVRRSYGPATTP